MKIYKIGIIGCGGIAKKMAATLGKMKEVECYAVASRSLEKARTFAEAWGFEKAYGSYEELADDPKVDLIYIATPHAMHYEMRTCALKKESLCYAKKHLQPMLAKQSHSLRLPKRKRYSLPKLSGPDTCHYL